MTRFVIVNPAWASLAVPYGFSYGLISNDQFWDWTAQAFVAAPTAANAIKPFAKSGSAVHASKFWGDIPDIVKQVSAEVLVFVHAPNGSGYGAPIDVFKLASPDPVAAIRPITVTTTVN